MKQQRDKFGREGPNWDKGQLVWLEGKNLRTHYPSAKLAPKRFGPFEITDIIGSGSYRLKLPIKWRIHPVFHASLLTPYKETKEYGVNYSRPPPEVVEGEEEFEVEDIIKAKTFGRNKQWRYLVKWKGYPNSDNEWVNLSDMMNSMDMVRKYHQMHPHDPKPSDRLMVACAIPKVFWLQVRDATRARKLAKQQFPGEDA